MRALVVGAGRLGRALATELLHGGHDARLLDPGGERLAVLPAALRGRAIHGSPLERGPLSAALDGCDAIAATTDDDALNAVVALAARRELGVPLAVAVVGNPARAQALEGLGFHVLCPTARAARELHLTLVRSGVESELELGGEAAVYRAGVPARLAGRALGELERPGRLLPVAVERAGQVLLADPGLRLLDGDVLHVAAVHRDDVSGLVGA